MTPHIIGLVLVAAALLPLPATVAAQKPRDQRVEVTSPRPRRVTTVHVRPRSASLGAGTIDWLDRTQAPPELDAPRTGAATVLADEITLAGTSYALGETTRLTLVAETIRISGTVRWNLSASRPGGRGGSLVILARKLVCAPGARWFVTSDGGANAEDGGVGGTGGNMTLAVDEVTAEGTEGAAAIPARRRGRVRPGRPMAARPPVVMQPVAGAATVPEERTDSAACLSFRSTAGRGTGRVQTFTDRGGKPATRRLPARHGTPGQLVRLESRVRAGGGDDEARGALSIWALEIMRRIRGGILEADAAGDYPKLIRLFQRYASFSPPVTIDAAQRREFDDLRAELNRYRGEVLLPVHPRPIDVDIAGVSHRMHVFTESSPFRSTLAPTHMLAVPTTLRGRDVLGVLEYDPAHPDDLAVDMELELSVDPWLASLAMEKLRASGDSVADMFTNWRLEPRAAEEIGVKESTITALPGGRRIRVRLIVTGDKAGSVFWKLLSGSGIPLTYAWEYRGQPGQPLTQGTWAGPTLSLARRAQHAVRIEEKRLHNDGNLPVSVEYVGLGPKAFVALPRAVQLKPDESVQLDSIGIPAGARIDSLWIPPEAVVTVLDPFELERSFHVINGQGFIEHLTVTNLLPAVDETLGGALEYVEVFVSIGSGADGDTSDVQAGPYRLSAAHTNGSEIRLPFLRQGKQQRVTISGAAYYANGSCQTISPTSVDAWAVKITRATLAGSRPGPDAANADAQGCSARRPTKQTTP